MAFGPFRNLFVRVTSFFGKAKEPFSKAVAYFKEHKFTPKVSAAYHAWKESSEWARKKVWVDDWGPDVPLDRVLAVPTEASLGGRRQYIFEVRIKGSKEQLVQVQHVSFLSDLELTKNEASKIMYDELVSYYGRDKYGHLEVLEVKFEGFRESLWGI